MACPYFDPVRPHPAQPQHQALPLPLGDSWVGLCRAGDGPPAEPDVALHSMCNLGYARGCCSRFPIDDAGPDAVRFAITSVTEPSLDLCYVLERDHHPFVHGSLRYSFAAGRFLPAPPGGAPP